MMAVAWLAGCAIVAVLLALVAIAFAIRCCSRAGKRHVVVVVLGDIGRSPRMQYHCMSLAGLPHTQVSVVGMRGERCVPAVDSNPRIRKVYLHPSPFRNCKRRYFLLYAPAKVIWQVANLAFVLCTMEQPSAFLVQNPPSIPTLLVTAFAAWLRNARFIIDWHNFGYTILALTLGARHPLVIISRVYERICGRMAHAHICVTEAMSAWLNVNWGVRATVVYDKAPLFFKPSDTVTKHDLFTRLKSDFPPDWAGPCSPGDTLFTEVGSNGQPRPRPNRPALLVSSTSWTPDEDFSILLQALVSYDKRAQAKRTLPKVWVVVTGKGPQRAMYEQRIRKLDMKFVSINTIWLESQDYPLLLGAADLGVCLHKSSSGLDLPMKVVDMYGCHLPVCAVSFACLPELVRHNENGLVFDTPLQLAEQLHKLLQDHPVQPDDASLLSRLRAGVRRAEKVRWQDNWTAKVAPLFV